MASIANLGQLYETARREGPSSSAWLVLADGLEGSGARRLARRLQRLASASIRLRRTPARERTAPGAPRSRLMLDLRREWLSVRRALDAMFERRVTKQEQDQVRRLARALSEAEAPERRHDLAFQLADLADSVGWPANPNIIPTGRRGPPEHYRVLRLDVWGNEEEGYEINNWFDAGELEVPTELHVWNAPGYRDAFMAGYRALADGRPLLEMLSVTPQSTDAAFERRVRQAYLRPGARVEFNDTGGEFVEVVQSEDGMPILHIHREREDD